MQVPFISLRIDDPGLEREIEDGIQQVIRSGAFAGGPFVSAFEADFAAFCETEHAIAVGNGTDALWLALAALGVGAGDEVITVPNTFIATVEAISMCGATPVFVDVDEKTFTIDPSKIERAITKKTKAIIPVHLYGQPADMDAILAIAKKHGLRVVEDACQAHGATYKSRKVGGLGDAGCFSFYPTKNLGAFGEAGAVVTNNRQVRDRIACLREHGQTARYQHAIVGWNARMDGIQGAVLKAKLKRLAEQNERRRAHATFYSSHLSKVPGLITPTEAAFARHVYHLYVVRVQGAGRRGALMQHLSSKGVGCLIHYPIPIHLQEAYSSLGLIKGAFPVAESGTEEILSLPMFPSLSSGDLQTVVTEIRAFFGVGAGV